MNIGTLSPILIAAAAIVLVGGLVLWMVMRKGRGNKDSQNLREHFGTEYDYAMETEGDQRKAEKSLNERLKRVNKMKINDLDENQMDRYEREWIGIQVNFVDDPGNAVAEANRLVTEVMGARGFPVADFAQREADLSVMYPDIVSNYRNANVIAEENERQDISEERLRHAIIYYRSMFAELLGNVGFEEEVEAKEGVKAKQGVKAEEDVEAQDKELVTT